jgi:hypothetical protein
MKMAINYFFRALCLLVYAMAAASLIGLLPDDQFSRAPKVAVVLLALHVIELVFVMKQVRLYKGPLAVSVALTLLFGLLHWKPLAQQQTHVSDKG